MSKDTGGPAFPFAVKGGNEPVKGHAVFGDIPKDLTTYYAGLSVRDYFAAKMMHAVIGSLNGSVTGEEKPGDFDYYAECAYKMADAMLRARGQ